MTYTATWEKHASNVEHYKALGIATVYLDDGSEKPWHLVHKIDIDGTLLMNMPNSQWATASAQIAEDLQAVWTFRLFRDNKVSVDVVTLIGLVPESVREKFLDQMRPYISELLRLKDQARKTVALWGACLASLEALYTS